MPDDPTGLDLDALRELLTGPQCGVVSTEQLRAIGARPHDVKRLVRRRELAPVHPGVLVGHTGPLTWEQRAWAAVLAHWPAALTRESALPHPLDDAPIRVAVDARRTVRVLPGVQVHRTADLDARVQWNRSPPRVRLEHAVLDLASEVVDDPARAFRLLADACQTRRTTASAIAATLAARQRVRGRVVLEELLDDLATGACSVLEREWLRVERAHGLPSPRRQRSDQAGGRRVLRDAAHAAYGLVVELDGRAFHDTAAARDHDAERDLDAAVGSGLSTVRLTWGQVTTRGCRTAARIGLLLQARGWPGQVTRCPGCA